MSAGSSPIFLYRYTTFLPSSISTPVSLKVQVPPDLAALGVTKRPAMYYPMSNLLLSLLLALFATTISVVNAYVSLVTGASGFVGRHVVYSLLQQQSDNDSNNNNNGNDNIIVCLVRPDKVSYEQSYWNAHLMDMQQSMQHTSNCWTYL